MNEAARRWQIPLRFSLFSVIMTHYSCGRDLFLFWLHFFMWLRRKFFRDFFEFPLRPWTRKQPSFRVKLVNWLFFFVAFHLIFAPLFQELDSGRVISISMKIKEAKRWLWVNDVTTRCDGTLSDEVSWWFCGFDWEVFETLPNNKWESSGTVKSGTILMEYWLQQFKRSQT